MFEGTCHVKCMLESLPCEMFTQMLDFWVFTPHDVYLLWHFGETCWGLLSDGCWSIVHGVQTQKTIIWV